MANYGTDIQQSDTIIGFWHTGGTRQVLLEWDSQKIKGVTCFFEMGGLWGVKSKIEFFDDGFVGRAIITFTADPYEGETLKEGSKTFCLINEDDSYRQNIEVEVVLHGTNETDFCNIETTAIFVPFHDYERYINYSLFGNTTISSIDAPNERGVYAEVYDDSQFRIVTIMPGVNLSGERVKKSQITVTYGNGSVSYINVWMIMPHVKQIWQDIDASIKVENNSIDYTISKFKFNGNKEIIYTGKAYRMPDQEFIKINVNKICETFLYEDATPGGPDRYSISFDYGTGFTLETKEGDLIGSYVLYNSWSYKEWPRMYGLTFSQSSPLSYEIVRGQTFLNSIWTCNYNPDNNNKNYCFLKESPTQNGDYTDVPGFDHAFLEPWQYTVINFNTKHVKPDTNYLLAWNATYKLVDNCGIDYVLHYLDRDGGYSSFPIKGNVNLKTNRKAHTMNQTFNNNTSNFEVQTYLNEVFDVWEVTLPLLTKDQAGRIWELTQSPQIWLERLEDNKFIPVLLEGDDTDLKNNRKIRNYTFTLKASQSKLRK